MFKIYDKKQESKTFIENSKYQEQIVVILLSIVDCGGKGTKKQVLDNIQQKKYINLKLNPLLMEYTRKATEPRWKNQLAYERIHLISDGFINGSTRDIWRITDEGENNLIAGILILLLNRKQNVYSRYLSDHWYKRAKDFFITKISLEHPLYSTLLTPDFIQEIEFSHLQD